MSTPGGGRSDDLEIRNSDFVQKVDVQKHHFNIDQTLLTITEDKIRIVLTEEREALRGRLDWVEPLALVVALSSALVATDFQDKYGLPSSGWETIFWIATIASAIWFAYTVRLSLRRPSPNKAVDQVLERFRGSSG
jgi:hypothetical protein